MKYLYMKITELLHPQRKFNNIKPISDKVLMSLPNTISVFSADTNLGGTISIKDGKRPRHPTAAYKQGQQQLVSELIREHDLVYSW